MRLTKSNYEKSKAYRTIREAIEAVEFTPEELNNEKLISVGIGIDAEGRRWYAVGEENIFTNCYHEDLENIDDWYEDDWIEREEPSFYSPYTFDTYKELSEWLQSRRGDMRKIYYYGCLENYSGELYNIEDIISDTSLEGFEPVEIYEAYYEEEE